MGTISSGPTFCPLGLAYDFREGHVGFEQGEIVGLRDQTGKEFKVRTLAVDLVRLHQQ
jgi:hypothetical protein